MSLEVKTQLTESDTDLSRCTTTTSLEKSGKTPIIINVVELQQALSESTPLDTGRAAYTVLVGSFLLQSAIAGFPLCYGIFQEYYTREFTDHGIASWIGVLCEGMPYLGAPLMSLCLKRYELPRKCYIWVGFTLCVLGLLASAFVQGLNMLIVTQGVLFGLGSMLIEIPSLSILDSHFSRRRGLAYGLCFGGADLYGMASSFLASHLLNKYGLKLTMLVFMTLTIAIAGPGAWLMEPRNEGVDPNAAKNIQPVRRVSTSSMSRCTVEPTVILRGSISPIAEESAQPEKRFYQRSIFYILNIANFLFASIHQLPGIYLPTFAAELGYKSVICAAILAVANLAQMFGEIGFGRLSDKVHVNYLVVATMSVASISTFVLWGALGSTSLAVLFVYAFLFSSFDAGFLALWARIGMLFGERDDLMVYSILSCGRGVATIISGPVSQLLLSKGPRMTFGIREGGHWGALIVYIGGCTSLSAILGVLAIVALWWKADKIMSKC